MTSLGALLLALALPAAPLPDWQGGAPPGVPTQLAARADALLLGTDSGFYERRGPAGAWKLVLARDAVRGLAPTAKGALIASGGGLFEWDAERGEARELALGAGAEVRGVAVDARGTAWVASAAGLYRRDAGAREFAREPGLPAGEIGAVASSGADLWLAIDGALWSGAPGRSFALAVSGLEPDWWPLCGAVAAPEATLLCVPGGVLRVSKRGTRRIELGVGRLFALARAGERLYLAAEGGVYAFDPESASRTARQELSVPAYGLAVAGDELLVATENGIAGLSLVAHAAAPRAPETGAVPERGTAPRPPEPRPSDQERALRDVPARSRASQIQTLQRAALSYLELSPSRMAELEQRARRSGFYPELRASFVYDRDTSSGVDHDEVFTSGIRTRLFDSGSDRSHGYDVGVTLVWELSDFASPDHALAISRERRSLVTLRDQVLERVNHLYFGRLRVLAQLDALGPADGAKRAELELDAAELAAQLDAWSGGVFSRLADSSPPEARREP